VANPARLRIVKTKLQAIDASQVTDADQITCARPSPSLLCARTH